MTVYVPPVARFPAPPPPSPSHGKADVVQFLYRSHVSFWFSSCVSSVSQSETPTRLYSSGINQTCFHSRRHLISHAIIFVGNQPNLFSQPPSPDFPRIVPRTCSFRAKTPSGVHWLPGQGISNNGHPRRIGSVVRVAIRSRRILRVRLVHAI